MILNWKDCIFLAFEIKQVWYLHLVNIFGGPKHQTFVIFFLSTICLHPNPVVLTVCCPVNSDSSETTPRLYECAREWSVGVHPRARQGFKLRKDFTCLGKKEGLTWNCHCIEISSLSHSLYLCSVCFLTWKKMNKSFTTCLSPSLSLCVLWGRRTWEYVQYEQHVQISDNIYIFVFYF